MSTKHDMIKINEYSDNHFLAKYWSKIKFPFVTFYTIILERPLINNKHRL